MKILLSSLLSGLALIVLPLAGCESVETRSYEITVKNDSTKPVTVWLTKNGPVWESGWKSPEDLAIESPRADEPVGGSPLPPGKTAYTQKVTGHFAPHVDAILRIYLGLHSFNQLLAMDRDSPDRIDIKLEPGANQIVVKDNGSGIQAQRVSP